MMSSATDGQITISSSAQKRRILPHLRFAHKFALLIALLLATTAVVQGYVLYRVAANGIIELEEARLNYRLGDSARGFLPNFQYLQRNVTALSQTPPIQGIINTTKNGGRFGNSTTEDWRRRLSVIFAGLISANPSYSQVRYIGVADGGLELVRVNRIDGGPFVVADEDLQPKGDRTYFQETLAMPQGATYFSEIELNREFGEILIPYEPTLRASTPIYDENGEIFGLVIINVAVDEWINDLPLTLVDTDTLYLANDSGGYIYHPDASKRFGFDLGQDDNLANDIPAISPLLSVGGPEEVEFSDDASVTNGFRLHFDSERPERFLVFAASAPKDVLLASTNEMRNWSIFISAILILIGIVAAHFASRPLSRLSDAAKRMAQLSGNGVEGASPETSDEIGVLANAFQVMTGAVADREASLLESEAKTRSILESAGSAILTVNDHGRIESANGAASNLLQFSTGDLLGSSLERIVPAAKRWSAERMLRSYEAAQETEALRADGRKIPILLSVSNVKLPNRTLYTVIVSDLSEVKKAEKAKNEFVSVVSHELRTPLTSIRGALGLIAGNAAGKLPEKASELVGIAHKNSERLVRLINDILDIEKLDAGKVQLRVEPLSITELIETAIESNAAYGEKYGVRFVLKPHANSLQVSADSDRTLQVLTNLLSNAAKFSEPGSIVEVGVQATEKLIGVTVTDHGCGIPDEAQSNIFEKFVQADHSNTRKFEGTGLGLAITKQLVEAMQGNIGFSSKTGEGTTFSVRLPRAADLILDHAPIGASSIGGFTVLICEDDHAVVDGLRAILHNSGFEVDVASTLNEARELIVHKDYCALVLDLVLSNGSSSEFIRGLRSEERTKDLPIVVVSAKSDDGSPALSGDALGIADWVQQPVSHEALIEIVLRAIRRKTAKAKILHIEDDGDFVSVIANSLQGKAELLSARTLRSARELLMHRHFDLIILDLALPDGTGTEIFETLAQLPEPAPPIVVLSASDTDDQTRSKVAAALVKSRMSETKIVEIILSMLPPLSGERAGIAS